MRSIFSGSSGWAIVRPGEMKMYVRAIIIVVAEFYVIVHSMSGLDGASNEVQILFNLERRVSMFSSVNVLGLKNYSVAGSQNAIWPLELYDLILEHADLDRHIFG